MSVLFQRTLAERTGGHSFKLIMPHCYTDVVWNRLPGEVIESGSLSVFIIIIG